MPTDIKPTTVTISKPKKGSKRLPVKREPVKTNKGRDVINSMTPQEYDEHLNAITLEQPIGYQVDNVLQAMDAAGSAIQLLDPTGISSVPSTLNAWTDDELNYKDLTEPLGLVPLFRGAKMVGMKGLVNPGRGSLDKVRRIITTGDELNDLNEARQGNMSSEQFQQELREMDNRLQNGGQMNNSHPFFKLAKVKNEKEFYDKYPDESSFFKKFPQAQYGYTLDNDGIPTIEESGALGYVTPQQEVVPMNNTTSAPTQSQSSSGGANTTGAIQAVAKGVGDVIGMVGGVNRAIQVGAPQLLNALIPDNQNERVRTPQVGYNQYAYGTGSQMMYENGGEIPLWAQDMPSDGTSANEEGQTFPNWWYTTKKLDKKRKQSHYNDILSDLISSGIENPKQYIREVAGYGEEERDLVGQRPVFGFDQSDLESLEKNTTVSTPVPIFKNGGYLQNEVYELSPEEITRLKQLGYEIETLW